MNSQEGVPKGYFKIGDKLIKKPKRKYVKKADRPAPLKITRKEVIVSKDGIVIKSAEE